MNEKFICPPIYLIPFTVMMIHTEDNNLTQLNFDNTISIMSETEDQPV